jgi:hypothetical protein
MALTALSMLAATSSAATFLVTNNLDSGSGSLRRAIRDARDKPGDDVVQINVTGTIVLARSLDIGDTAKLTITGATADTLSIDGAGLDRVFSIQGGNTLIEGLTIMNGNCGVAQQGGGIKLAGGTLELRDCAVVGNTVPQNVGVEENGGGVHADSASTFIARRTLFANNVVAEGLGGGVRCTGYMTLENCTFTANSASEAGGVSYRSDGVMTGMIESCTISGNSCSIGGGGIRIGEGVCGIRNTIVAGNYAPSVPDTDGVFSSLGHNLIGIIDTSTGWVGTDILGADPMLGPLASNGGPTQTMALLAGSPALNHGDPSTFPATDQRGTARPFNLITDIGAFESTEVVNHAPTADAGTDQTLNYSGSPVSVNLDGSGSSDPDGDALTYKWFEGATQIATGATPTVNLGPGLHTLRLVVKDAGGLSDDDEVQILVKDPNPPTITNVSATPNRLWPPNHDLVSITVNYTASDDTDTSLTVWLTATSTEADSGLGDDDKPNDIQPVNGHTIKLRAERFSKAGRTYTITIHAMDDSGSETTKTVTVFVPHDNSKK